MSFLLPHQTSNSISLSSTQLLQKQGLAQTGTVASQQTRSGVLSLCSVPYHFEAFLRHHVIEQECGSDVQLRAHLERLLEVESRAEERLELQKLVPGEIPYFAMEFVPDAQPIVQYVEVKGLSARGRLKLFATVCDAVHHGHQNGVIHRDLQPVNLLVDGQGDVKIIDFGVARSTADDAQAVSMHTRAGQLIGTLAYMSPEQTRGNPEAIEIKLSGGK